MLFGRDVNQHGKTGNAFNTITDNLIEREYEANVSAAPAM
jgi:hypothetical protein